jgi:putative membrane protein
MNKRWLLTLMAVLMVALLTFACKKTEETTTTESSTTSVSSTDTSMTDTASTMSTSGTDTAATAATTGTDSSTSTGSTGGTMSTLTEDEKKFMMAAAQGGMSEVSGGNMAASKGTHADVKAFGQRMVTDHSKANDELKQLAATKGVALPSEVSDEQKKMADHLNTLSGKAFDKGYMDDMVQDHVKDVGEFEKMSKDAKDPDLKAWVTKTLPTLQDHLKMAKATQKKVG